MGKNKIPIWENYDRYIPEAKLLLDGLLAISDRDYQVRVWAKARGPEMDWYAESVVGFDSDIDVFKQLLRKKKLKLSFEQIKAILRVYVMIFCFERKLEKEVVPQEWFEHEMYIIDHPYWAKVRRQAQYALRLLEKPQMRDGKSL